MNPRMFLSLVLVMTVGGCAGSDLPSDPPGHPANPEAAAAPLPSASPTLALNAPPSTAPAPVAAARAAATGPAVYTCPHHPQVVSNQPGDCPECGMKLTAKPATQPAPAGGHAGHDHAGHEGHGGRP